MTLDEYIKLQKEIQAQLAKITDSGIFKPLRTVQLQLRQSCKQFTALQNQIAQSLEPLCLALEQWRNINLAFEQYRNINLVLGQHINQQIANFIEAQQKIIEHMKAINFDFSATKISTESSSEIAQISLSIIDELLPEELNKPKEEILELSKQKKPLTWEIVINIIALIITIISFIQAQIADKRLTNIENSLHNIENSLPQLIEIQEKELNLLSQSYK